MCVFWLRSMSGGSGAGQSYFAVPSSALLTSGGGGKVSAGLVSDWDNHELAKLVLCTGIPFCPLRCAGFPGADKEYDIAMEYLTPSYGGILVDMSCGSGLFSRRWATLVQLWS